MSRVQIAVTFMDDSVRFYPVPEGGHWKLSNDYGIQLLIVGGLPPRVEIPLSNVRTWEILPLNGGQDFTQQCSVGDSLATGGRVRCTLAAGHPGAHWAAIKYQEEGHTWPQSRVGADGYPASVAPDPLARPATPDADEMCGATTESVACHLAPNHMDDHLGMGRGGGYHRWPQSATPDPVEVGRVVEWAERDAQGGRNCPASVTQRGQRWQCESPAGHHPADGHLNGSGELVWCGAPTEEVR